MAIMDSNDPPAPVFTERMKQTLNIISASTNS